MTEPSDMPPRPGRGDLAVPGPWLAGTPALPAAGWEGRIDYGGIIPFEPEPVGPGPIRPGYHRAFDPGLDEVVAQLFGRGRAWPSLVHRVVDEFEQGVVDLQLASQDEYARELVRRLIEGMKAGPAGARDFTQAEFARLMGVDRGRVSKWLSGAIAIPARALLQLHLRCPSADPAVPRFRILRREHLILGGFLRSVAFVQGVLGRPSPPDGTFRLDQESFLCLYHYHACDRTRPGGGAGGRADWDRQLRETLALRVAPAVAESKIGDVASYRRVLDEWEVAYLLAIKALACERGDDDVHRMRTREEVILFRPRRGARPSRGTGGDHGAHLAVDHRVARPEMAGPDPGAV